MSFWYLSSGRGSEQNGPVFSFLPCERASETELNLKSSFIFYPLNQISTSNSLSLKFICLFVHSTCRLFWTSSLLLLSSQPARFQLLFCSTHQAVIPMTPTRFHGATPLFSLRVMGQKFMLVALRSGIQSARILLKLLCTCKFICR
ncbi:uncharacterized protein LOC109946376 [Prunus persica]|uniref:uncharacterized protein LOC109946376 n=1 Tax=Prunus persica TaxID=3760 RepID=UPI0009AB4AE2|nr:uncharacterized protein LOC109946376 [Prunus persica]